MADFFDVMQLGEGEQMLQDICAAVERGKKQGWNKEQLLLELAKIPGVYVPSFYDVTYREDGRIEAVTLNRPGVPTRVTKAIVRDMDSFTPPETCCAASYGAVQDRACVEVAARLRAWLPLLSGRPGSTAPSVSAAPSSSATAPAHSAATPATMN